MNTYTFVVFYGTGQLTVAHRDIKAASYEAAQHDLLLMHPGMDSFSLTNTTEEDRTHGPK
jgi:hypothetical protein